MKPAHAIGLAFGIILGVMILAIMKSVGKYSDEKDYDERQIREQGRANKLAYRFTLLGLCAILVADSIEHKLSFNITPIVIVAVICISVLIFAIYCITHDAYYGINKMTNRKSKIVWILIIAANAMSLIVNIQSEGIIQDGKINGVVLTSGMTLILFAGILIASFIHGEGKEDPESEETAEGER